MSRRHPLFSRYRSPGIRRRAYAAILIFYRVEDERGQILHILHGAMDYEAILFPEE